MYRKDVRLPQQLQRAMAAEAEASREARAKVRLIGFSLQSLFEWLVSNPLSIKIVFYLEISCFSAQCQSFTLILGHCC